MHSSDPDERARLLADEARPLGADGFSDERIDELAFAFVNDHVGQGPAQFVIWARAEGPTKDPSVWTPRRGFDALLVVDAGAAQSRRDRGVVLGPGVDRPAQHGRLQRRQTGG
jgi:hypothetical protein